MSQSSYIFSTKFSLDAPLPDVWKVIYNFKDWKKWWRAVRSLKVSNDGTHQTIDMTIGTFLYSLAFKIIVLTVKEHKSIQFISTGDLEGQGEFVFTNRSMTSMIFDWKVRTTKPWMNVLSPVLRPLFVFSHNLVMRMFVNGIGRVLKAKVVGFENQSN